MDNSTLATKILELLNNIPERVLTVTTTKLSKLIKRPWRSILRNIMTPKFGSELAALGWCYVSQRGKLGSRFERREQDQSQGLASGVLSGLRSTGVQLVGA
jgi:hypothetical protein